MCSGIRADDGVALTAGIFVGGVHADEDVIIARGSSSRADSEKRVVAAAAVLTRRRAEKRITAAVAVKTREIAESGIVAAVGVKLPCLCAEKRVVNARRVFKSRRITDKRVVCSRRVFVARDIADKRISVVAGVDRSRALAEKSVGERSRQYALAADVVLRAGVNHIRGKRAAGRAVAADVEIAGLQIG